MELLIAAIAALFILSKGGLSGLSLPGLTAPVNVAPQGIAVASSDTTGANLAGVQAANTALVAVPVVGPALSAVASALTRTFAAASALRAKQATTENAAVAQAVPGWDAAVTQIVNAYNAGSVSAAQVSQLLAAIMANYWNEVTPQIQPGRNGCQGGANVPAFPIAIDYCSGSIGAACCVGFADLQTGVNNMEYAVGVADNSGKPTPAIIPRVYPSKYGGIVRAAYTVTFARPAASFTL